MTTAYKALPASTKEIANYARELRKACGYEYKKQFPIMHFLELILPRMFPDLSLELLEVDEMPFKEGETLPGSNTIRLRKDIYLAACDNDGRARFTVAHEIGHFLLHTPDSIVLCRMEKGQKLRAFEDPEWQANCFASELLSPVYLAKGMSKAAIMEQFLLSERAAKVVVSKCRNARFT